MLRKVFGVQMKIHKKYIDHNRFFKSNFLACLHIDVVLLMLSSGWHSQQHNTSSSLITVQKRKIAENEAHRCIDNLPTYPVASGFKTMSRSES